jgi:hypothetical protein
MQDDPWQAPPFSRDALYIFGLLDRRGGTMRIALCCTQSRACRPMSAAAVNESPSAAG